MRKVPGLPPRINIVDGREVKAVSAARTVKTALASNQPVSGVDQYKRYDRHHQPHPAGAQDEPGRRTVFPEDRRKANMRVSQQKILVEFRSGSNRRRRHQRGSDVVEHIDEKA